MAFRLYSLNDDHANKIYIIVIDTNSTGTVLVNVKYSDIAKYVSKNITIIGGELIAEHLFGDSTRNFNSGVGFYREISGGYRSKAYGQIPGDESSRVWLGDSQQTDSNANMASTGIIFLAHNTTRGTYGRCNMFPNGNAIVPINQISNYENGWFYDTIPTGYPTHQKIGSVSLQLKGSYLTDNIILSISGNTDPTNWGNWLERNHTPIDTDDPNLSGGDSASGGGGGDGDIGGDTNPDDGLPTISPLDSGLLTAYNPTVAELQNLGKFLWSDSFNVDTFKKLFNDPFDTLLGLSIIPISPNTSGTKNIMFGNLDSGVSAPVVANQWVSKDMGSVTLKEVWKGALDYAPSTSASIYLPFIGMRQLNINDVMGSTLHLIYKFDVLTGGCVAQIYINHNAIGNKDGGFSWTTNQGLVYEFMGQCAVNIPLASQDFTNTIRSAVSAVGMVAGASASIATGNPVLGIATATVASANLGMQANTPTVERSGHLSGSCAILGYNQPFLVVTRPHQCKPSRYYALRGVPSQVYTSKLSNCTGFTQITANNNIHCSGAQDSELQEIQNLLVSGVYFPDKKR